MHQEGSSRQAAFPFEVGPIVTGAFYDDLDGSLTVNATEALDLDSGASTPWTVTFDGVPQVVSDVDTSGPAVVLTTPTGGGATVILLSYSGGGYVVGLTTGLALQAVTDFPVGIV